MDGVLVSHGPSLPQSEGGLLLHDGAQRLGEEVDLARRELQDLGERLVAVARDERNALPVKPL